MALCIPLFACSAGTEATNNSTNTVSSPPADTTSLSSPATTASSQVVPGVKDIKEITFKPVSSNPQTLGANGFFDGTAASNEKTIEVEKGSPVTLQGWAILADEGKPADAVIITHGDNNSLVVVAPVNKEREDVAKNLENQGYKNSGWAVPVDTASLPANVELKAWAYDADSKEARQLSYTHELILK